MGRQHFSRVVDQLRVALGIQKPCEARRNGPEFSFKKPISPKPVFPCTIWLLTPAFFKSFDVAISDKD
jgi:hypothetical protein